MRTILLSALALVLLSTPATSNALTVDELTAQLQALLLQVNQLQGQIGGPNTPTPATTGVGCVTVNRTLRMGSTGDDVTSLQQFLVSLGLLSADSMTGYFGPKTEAALQKWQAQQGIASSGTPDTTGFGMVGPRTRAALANCGTAPVGAFVQVTPITGNVPLTTTIVATVNTTRGCSASGYSLDYGDGTAKTYINVPQGTCNELKQTLSHIYNAPGTFYVTIEAGGHKSSATVTVTGGNSTISGGSSSALPISFTTPGTFTLSVGQSAVSGTFSLRLENIRQSTVANGALVGTTVDITAREGNSNYIRVLNVNDTTQIGTNLLTLKSITGNKARFDVTSNSTGSTDSGSGSANVPANFSVLPGTGGSLLNVTARFDLGSSCSAYDVDWGDGTAHATQAQGSCAAGAGQKTLTHSYAGPGSYTITLTRGAVVDSANITISN